MKQRFFPSIDGAICNHKQWRCMKYKEESDKAVTHALKNQST
jgi:hypothetical protein